MAELGSDAPAQITIETGIDPSGAPVVAVSGDLDISNADSLESTVASIAAARPERMIFDLSRLRFMDSAGIAVLLRATAEVDAVSLREPSPGVRRIVELTGLADILPIEP